MHQLIDSFERDDHADLNIEFCAPIPMLTITGSFGLTDRGGARGRGPRSPPTAATRPPSSACCMPIIAARREEPTDDLISVLVQAEIADEDGVVHRLDDGEVLAFGFLLLAAGSGTTWKQMGITLLALLRTPRRSPRSARTARFLRNLVEESLRWTPTDPVFSRFAAEDTELGGVEIPAGAVMHICLAAANRDPPAGSGPTSSTRSGR